MVEEKKEGKLRRKKRGDKEKEVGGSLVVISRGRGQDERCVLTRIVTF